MGTYCWSKLTCYGWTNPLKTKTVNFNAQERTAIVCLKNWTLSLLLKTPPMFKTVGLFCEKRELNSLEPPHVEFSRSISVMLIWKRIVGVYFAGQGASVVVCISAGRDWTAPVAMATTSRWYRFLKLTLLRPSATWSGTTAVSH